MPTATDQVGQIRAIEKQMERQAAEAALRNKQLAARRAARDQVVDKVTGDVYTKRRFSLTAATDFTLTVNTLNVLSEIARLNAPGVPLGLEFMFVPVKESYGYEYIVPRMYGAIRDVVPADILDGRLVIVVESPQGIEKTGARLLDTSPERFNAADPADRNLLLSYQVSESFRAMAGDSIVWRMNSPIAMVAANTRFTMEVVALERTL